MGKGEYKFTAKSIEHSTVAVGHKANATTGAGTHVDRSHLHSALEEVEKLIEGLTERQNELANGRALLASAADVKEKLTRKKLKLKSIRSALKVLGQIAEGVAGVGVLADTVVRIQTLIAHLVS
jgi:hypothetical protein